MNSVDFVFNVVNCTHLALSSRQCHHIYNRLLSNGSKASHAIECSAAGQRQRCSDLSTMPWRRASNLRPFLSDDVMSK
jgi:hypothetical protein